MPSILHRKAKAYRHRRESGEVQEQVRQEGEERIRFRIPHAALIILLLTATSPESQPNRLDSLVQEGLELSYFGRFLDAAEVFEKVIDEFPAYPSGYLLKAASLDSYMSDFSTFDVEEEFYALLDTTIQRGTALLDGGRGAAEIQFFIGAAHFYKAFHRGRKREYLGAMAELARAKPWLDRAVSTDSSFLDVYLGLGVLRYLSAKVKGFVIPFGGQGYDEPIAMIERATGGKYTSVLAQEALVLALAGASRWEEAERQAMELIRSYPTNRLFYWGLVEAYRVKKDPDGIVSVGHLLLDQILRGQPEHLYNQSVVRSYLAEAYLDRGELGECIKQCDMALSLLEGSTDKRDVELEEGTANLRRKAARALAKKVDR